MSRKGIRLTLEREMLNAVETRCRLTGFAEPYQNRPFIRRPLHVSGLGRHQWLDHMDMRGAYRRGSVDVRVDLDDRLERAACTIKMLAHGRPLRRPHVRAAEPADRASAGLRLILAGRLVG